MEPLTIDHVPEWHWPSYEVKLETFGDRGVDFFYVLERNVSTGEITRAKRIDTALLATIKAAYLGLREHIEFPYRSVVFEMLCRGLLDSDKLSADTGAFLHQLEWGASTRAALQEEE